MPAKFEGRELKNRGPSFVKAVETFDAKLRRETLSDRMLTEISCSLHPQSAELSFLIDIFSFIHLAAASHMGV